MLKRITQAIWGKFESREEVQKFVILALMFCLIIGIYWTLRPIKDSAFMAIVGGKWLWMAKICSLFVITPLVILYTKLTDMFPRQKFFYVLLITYALITLFFMLAFMHPEYGFANTAANPTRIIGWAWYVFVESFGSLAVALFWAITTDITLPGAARRGFPLIALFGQMGNIVGPYFFNPRMLGFVNSAPIVGIVAVFMLITACTMWIFFKVTPKNQLVSYKEEKMEKKTGEEPGFLEGLKLLVTKGYLFGIFAIVFLYEFIVTLIDYHFKQTVFASFSTEGAASTYLSQYAWKVGVVATLSVLFGINNIQRRLGMIASLILLPILVGGAVLLISYYPEALHISLWIMVFSKAINYALNQPTIKQLYIPTSRDTKYKAQAWIDMFGSRGSKSVASCVNGTRGILGIPLFLAIISVSSMGLIAVWMMLALYIAKTYNKAIADETVVC